MLQVGREGLDFAENLVEGGVDFAENLVEGAVDSAPHIGEHIIDAAQDVGEHIGIPTSGDDDGDPSLDDVDMYAGAGPRDLDDGGPTGGGYAAKASLSNFKQLAEICLLDHKHTLRHQHISCTPRASQLRFVCLWGFRCEEDVLKAALKVAKPEAIPYKMTVHAFHAGRSRPSPDSPVTLVTQCSADRLPSVLKQATKWGGDISLAVLIPSAPTSAAAETTAAIRRLCDTVDEAHSSDPSQTRLSLDVAILEGAEADTTRHDHCGALYPINALRNLALLQARDAGFHPAATALLVDSDCIPAENLLSELSLADVQERILPGEFVDTRCREGIDEAEVAAKKTLAIVVPCLEAAAHTCFDELESISPPATTKEAVSLLREGLVQGFHVDYFPKGHGPTDFLRAAAICQLNALDPSAAVAYTVPFSPCFEPYVVVAKTVAPMYDERFRGYGMNKVSDLKRPISIF
ncbi:unnamed protein product [Sphacelaria rigidula]